MQLICLDSIAIDELVEPHQVIEWVHGAMIATSARDVELPLRQAMKVSDEIGAIGIMPGYLGTKAAAGVKLVSLVPPAARKGSSHLGLFVLYDADGLVPVALLDGGHVTAIRTAAASAVATRALSREDSRIHAILGAGEQAYAHAKAISSVRDISEIRIWSRTSSSSKQKELVEKLCAEGFPARAFANLRQATIGADVITTVTSSADPILTGEDVSLSAHVNLVGSSHSGAREVTEDLLHKAKVFLDYEPSARAQAGEIMSAVEKGTYNWNQIKGEIGEVLSGQVTGRENASQITVYKSLGIASQDIVTAHNLYELAKSRRMGEIVTFDHTH